jgi:glycosyltransferase involved in cell wall biosynthesis
MMENKYEVTIGIPVYNVEKYMRLTMDSLMSQTFDSIEFLFCDDCGTDASVDIIRDYQQNHPRGKDIRVVRQPENMGIGAARNRMIAEARGRYFYSLDADDAIESNTIELLYENAKKYDAEIVYGSYQRVFQENDKTVKTVPYPYPFRVFTKEDEYADYVYNVGIQGMNWNYLIDLDVIRRNNLKVTPVGHGYGEDFTFTIDLPTYITRAVLLPDITYHYYIRGVDKHKRKKVLKRKDMSIALNAIDEKKKRKELQDKGYYAKRISILMMFDCSFACEMLSRRAEFDIPFSNREIRDVMWHPMSLWQILTTKAGRRSNLLYYIYSILPPDIFALLLRMMIKRYRD